MKTLTLASFTSALALLLWLAPAAAEAGVAPCQDYYCTTTSTEGVCGTSNPAAFLDPSLPQQAASQRDCRKICERQAAMCMSIAAANGRCERKDLNSEVSNQKVLCKDDDSDSDKECRRNVVKSGIQNKLEVINVQRAAQRGCREYKASCLENCSDDDRDE